jgi:hypothetical protein
MLKWRLWLISSSEVVIYKFLSYSAKIQWVLSSADKSKFSVIPLSSFRVDKHIDCWLRATNKSTKLKQKMLSTSQLLANRRESDRDCEWRRNFVTRYCTCQVTKQQLTEQSGDNFWSTQTPGVQKHTRTAATDWASFQTKLAQQKKYTGMHGRDNF